MYINRVLILIFVLLLNNIASAQRVSNLYTFIINDCYNELRTKGNVSEHDTLYFTCGFCDCRGKCFDYDIDLKNDKIQFDIPIVNRNHS